jgi:hypothetical protein
MDPTLQRWFLTVGAAVLGMVAWKYFPGAPDWTHQLLRDSVAISAGIAIGKAHFTKPGDIKAAEVVPANEVGPL